MKQLLHGIKQITELVMLVVLTVVVFALVTSKTDLIAHIRSFTVVTGSMEPTVHVGSVVFTYPQSTYKRGEIITFHRGDISVTHRIVDLVKKGSALSYQTKGDANNAIDQELVPANKVIGRVENIVPSVGKFSAFIKTPQGFILFIIIPTLFIVITELWSIKKEIEKNVEKKIMAKMQTV